MTEQEAQAEEPLRMSAYYYSFEPTGVIQIDRILSAVARAGKAYHHTEQWDDDAYGGLGSPVEWIQDAANGAALAWQASRKPVAAPSDTDRETLAGIIQDVGEYVPGSHAADYVNPYTAADAILAAGFSRASQPVQVEGDAETRLGMLLWELTDGRMSGTGYDVPTMVQEVEAAFERHAEAQPVQVKVTAKMRERAVDAVYDLGEVGTNYIPEYQANLIYEVVDAVLTAALGGSE